MKYLLSFFCLLLAGHTFAQDSFPEFLKGTWKMENSENYERWDQLNDHSLKGFSYKVKNDQILVSEYLEILKKGKEIIYSATVMNQNEGRSINFKLLQSDSLYVFENPDHDFPKKIVYQKLSDTTIFVSVSDGHDKGFAYKMEKQISKSNEQDKSNSNPNYDAELAEKLGGDDYGMKSFILVILKTGTNKTTDKDFISKSFKGHLENIGQLVEEGKLIVAGPMGKNENNYRGIFILNNIATLEEASELMQTDPAIQSGLLDIELYNWYGSAALPEYLDYSDKIWKIKP